MIIVADGTRWDAGARSPPGQRVPPHGPRMPASPNPLAAPPGRRGRRSDPRREGQPGRRSHGRRSGGARPLPARHCRHAGRARRVHRTATPPSRPGSGHPEQAPARRIATTPASGLRAVRSPGPDHGPDQTLGQTTRACLPATASSASSALLARWRSPRCPLRTSPRAVSPGEILRCAPRSLALATMPAPDLSSCRVPRRDPPLRSSLAGARHDAHFGPLLVTLMQEGLALADPLGDPPFMLR